MKQGELFVKKEWIDDFYFKQREFQEEYFALFELTKLPKAHICNWCNKKCSIVFVVIFRLSANDMRTPSSPGIVLCGRPFGKKVVCFHRQRPRDEETLLFRLYLWPHGKSLHSELLNVWCDPFLVRNSIIVCEKFVWIYSYTIIHVPEYQSFPRTQIIGFPNFNNKEITRSGAVGSLISK